MQRDELIEKDSDVEISHINSMESYLNELVEDKKLHDMRYVYQVILHDEIPIFSISNDIAKYVSKLLEEIEKKPSPKDYISQTQLWEKRFRILEKQTCILKLKLEMLETNRFLQIEEEEYDKAKIWPEFEIEEFNKIIENSKGFEESDEDEDSKLYYVMELESLLGKVEQIANNANYKYEGRLAASLRDICKIHEPSELTSEQINCFTGSLRALIEGWGALNREKVKWIRGRLLEIGLTWLPVTKKAQKVIDEAESTVT